MLFLFLASPLLMLWFLGPPPLHPFFFFYSFLVRDELRPDRPTLFSVEVFLNVFSVLTNLFFCARFKLLEMPFRPGLAGFFFLSNRQTLTPMTPDLPFFMLARLRAGCLTLRSDCFLIEFCPPHSYLATHNLLTPSCVPRLMKIFA